MPSLVHNSRNNIFLWVIGVTPGWQSRTLHLHAVPAVSAQYVRISGIAKKSRNSFEGGGPQGTLGRWLLSLSISLFDKTRTQQSPSLSRPAIFSTGALFLRKLNRKNCMIVFLVKHPHTRSRCYGHPTEDLSRGAQIWEGRCDIRFTFGKMSGGILTEMRCACAGAAFEKVSPTL